MDFGRIVEEKIKQSIEKGDFDQLPGMGKPLPKDEFSHVPSELRNSFRVLKNAGMLPEEMQLKKEIVELEELLATVTDPEQSNLYKKKLTEKQIRFDLLMEKRRLGGTGAYRRYQNLIRKRLGF